MRGRCVQVLLITSFVLLLPAPQIWSQSKAVDPFDFPAVEREKKERECPGCIGILLYYVNANTGSSFKWWLEDDQEKWLKQYDQTLKKREEKQRLFRVNYESNADYFVFWSKAEGSRPQILYIPQVTTETTQFSGTYTTAPRIRQSQTGSFSGTVQVQKLGSSGF